jgi:hypothetical protein
MLQSSTLFAPFAAGSYPAGTSTCLVAAGKYNGVSTLTNAF